MPLMKAAPYIYMLDSGQQMNKLDIIKLLTNINSVNIHVENLSEGNIPKFGNTCSSWMGKRHSGDLSAAAGTADPRCKL